MKTPGDNSYLSIAVPKGRLLDNAIDFFNSKGIDLKFEKRNLIAINEKYGLKFMLVKNSDLPVYISHGIAGLGICGSDVIEENDFKFYKLFKFGFGSTKICLACRKDLQKPETTRGLKIATSYIKFVRNYYGNKGIPVEIIRLEGSVELAPVLGLADYIVDLVETGSTLEANNLKVVETLAETNVFLIANPAYYKINCRKIDALVDIMNR